MSKKVIKSDLSSESLSNVINNLTNDAQDAGSLKDVLSNIVNDTSNELEGASYDAVRNKLSEYITLLSKREELATSLAEAIKTSTSKMSDFMGEFDTIDASELDEVNKTIQSLEGTISSITQKFNNGEYDSDVTLYSLTSTYKKDLTKQKNYLEKINQLDSKDSQYYSSIEEVNSEITSYKTSISSITESKIS